MTCVQDKPRFEESFMHRVAEFPKRHTATALAIMICLAHLLVVAVYVFGLAVSPLPYNSDKVKSFIVGPVIPVSHAIAAILIIVACFVPRVRPWAAIVACSVWAGYAAALAVSAAHHVPRGSYIGVAVCTGVFLVTTIIVAAWGVDEDDKG